MSATPSTYGHGPWTLDDAGRSPARLLDAAGNCLALVYLTERADGAKVARRTPAAAAVVELIRSAQELREFVATIAAMETAEEYDDRTDGDGMSGDDAVDTVSRLVTDARALIEPKP